MHQNTASSIGHIPNFPDTFLSRSDNPRTRDSFDLARSVSAALSQSGFKNRKRAYSGDAQCFGEIPARAPSQLLGFAAGYTFFTMMGVVRIDVCFIIYKKSGRVRRRRDQSRAPRGTSPTGYIPEIYGC